MWYTQNMNMNLENRTSEEIMMRISMIYKIKRIAFSEYTNTFLLCGLLVYTFFVVSVIDVFTNALSVHSLWGTIMYFAKSLIHSQFSVQILAGLILVVSLRFAINSIRKISSSNLVSKLAIRRAI